MRAHVPADQFYVMYGQTEATARISCLEPERWEEKAGSVGRPLDNLTVRIVDEQGNDLPAGQSRRSAASRGPSVCSGYWNDPRRNAVASSATAGCEPAIWLARMRKVTSGSKGAKGHF